MWEFLLSFFRTFLNAILLGFGGFLISYLVARFSTGILAKWMGKFWGRFLGSLIGLGLAVWTVKLVLDSTGAEGMAVVVITAVTGAFALGSSMIAADLVAGISLFFSKPYDVGHLVSLAGREGKVVNISLFQTIIENSTGDRIFIRNSEVNGQTIVNYSANPGQLISVKVPFPLNQDLNLAISVIESAIQGFSPELTDEKHKPVVLVETGGFGYFTIEARAYVVERFDYSSEKTRLYLLSTNALLKAGLKLMP